MSTERTPELVRSELESFIRTAGLWHFDDGMEDQIEAATGDRSFSAWEVLCGTALLDEAFEVLGGDAVWAIGMDEYHDSEPECPFVSGCSRCGA